MADTNAQRQARRKEKKREAGEVPKEIWIKPEWDGLIKEFIEWVRKNPRKK
jgi:hypothetical protein